LTKPIVKDEPARLGAADFFARSRARLTFHVPPGLYDPNIVPTSGDPGTDKMLRIIAREQPVRPAAVLIPIIDHPEPTVLLTQRSAHLSDHAGQIAFPGGKIDAGDASPAAAALREAREEIGLAPELVQPIGYLDLYLTFSGYRILPTVARVQSDYRLTLCEAEVADAFEVPLAFLMDVQNHALHSRDWKGITRKYYAMPFGDRYIWGVTAGILRNLFERIYQQ
jgi:8-oxo-dGTP pyrophosphatase MutT (NUDIX family)